jgi:hypothetical protein
MHEHSLRSHELNNADHEGGDDSDDVELDNGGGS